MGTVAGASGMISHLLLLIGASAAVELPELHRRGRSGETRVRAFGDEEEEEEEGWSGEINLCLSQKASDTNTMFR